MTRAITIYMRAAALAVTFHHVAQAQQCYYPNGNKAPDTEKPCSTAEGSACCPEKWECMDNGLCYYDPDKLYGRYSCTDKDWKSSGCPSNMCTYDMNAPGGEAVTQCSNHGNQWCCDGDRTNVNCCRESPQPRPFFMLQDPVAYGTAGGNIGSSAPNLASITGQASGSGSSSGSPSSTAPPSASTSAASASSPSSPSTGQSDVSSGFSTSATSGSTGRASSTAGPTNTADIPPPGSLTDPSPKHNNVGLIVGCAVGIPLALCLLGILIWLLRKRRQLKASPTSASSASSPSMHKHEYAQPGIPELGDGQGVGPTRPISTIPGHAEMDSGSAFAPGTIPYSPAAVGVGGGHGGRQGHTSWGSDGSHHHMDSSPAPNPYSVLGGGDGGPLTTKYGYSAGAGGLNNVPEMAELPSVVTPPEAAGAKGVPQPAMAELGDPSPPVQTHVNAAGEYPGMMR